MRIGKKLLAISLSLALISSMCVSAYASESNELLISENTLAYAENEVTVILDDTVTIMYNNAEQYCYTEQGDRVYPAIYRGTTYIPIRALSYILGMGVEWEASTRSVVLSIESKSTAPTPTGNVGEFGQVAADLDPSITVLFNDSKQIFKDVNNRQMDPLIYKGTVYLPVRGVSTMLSMQIDWIQQTRTIDIKGEPLEEPVCTPCEYRRNDLLNQNHSEEGLGQLIVGHDGATTESSGVSIAGTGFSNQLFIENSTDKNSIYYFDNNGSTKLTTVALYSGDSEVKSLVAFNPDTGDTRNIQCISLKDIGVTSYGNHIVSMISNMENEGITPEDMLTICDTIGAEIDITGWERVGFYFTDSTDKNVIIMAAKLSN